jgi:imidazolonepropionase-like amidohydrolase
VPSQYLLGWPLGSFTANWTAAQYAAARQQWPKQLALARMLYEKGVLLTAGTDTPTPWIIPGVSLHQELALLSEAGMPNIDVLKAATSNAAIALERDGDAGIIRPGAIADIVVLEKNPLTDIRCTRSIRLVIRKGSVFAPSDLVAGMLSYKSEN